MQNLYVTVQINGEPFNCSSDMSLYDIIQYLSLDSRMTVIEYNKEIISNNKLDTISLRQNDQLEIITIVGGG
jgi:sulfur carrier protein